ncbi:MAG TPA: serine/threonine-protein kinase, partial [Kofleriaceae bacterium]|nr:serine/threonine-protein kinase [Kofleriaceae bacterium]
MTATILASRYRLGALLGAGGMGAVYQAEDLEHGREVAVKLVRPELAGDAAARGYLDAEVRMTGRVVHRNVVALLAAGETERHEPYVVMELVRGRSLRDVVRAAGPLSPRRACSIVQQVLAGLEAIHAAGFVHGDVKSENVLIDESGRALLIDLGLSRRHSEVPG